MWRLARPAARQRSESPGCAARQLRQETGRPQWPTLLDSIRNRRHLRRSERMLQKSSIRCLTLKRRVAQGPVQQVVTDQRVDPFAKMVGCTGPRLLLQTRALHVVWRHLIDVTHAGKQVAFRLDDSRPETPLPQTARVGMAAVEAAAVAPPHRLHHQTETVAASRRGEQANFVVEQGIGMNRHTVGRRRRLQQLKKELPVGMV